MRPELLGSLAERHGPALVLYARQWCAAPEDVVQEAFLKLVRQRTPPDNPVPWLFRVVRNAARTAARTQRRRHKYESAAAAQAPTWFLADDSTGLDATSAGEALQTLPLEQREVIVAHLWGELTFEQIAELAGCAPSTAHRWFLSGLATLRERLKVICPPPKTPN
jgi:RNA polymerase sigma-70 factor (ECF subfamily)